MRNQIEPPQIGRFFIFAVLILGSIGFIATDLYLPSLPSIVNDFSTTKAHVQLTLSFFLFTFALSQLIYGPLSDKIGRRKVILIGLGITIIGSLVCLFSPNITILIIGRFIEGIGVGSGITIMRIVLRDVYVGDELARKGSFIAVSNGIFMALAPILGGYLVHFFNWRSNFAFIVVYILAVMLIIITCIPETIKEFNPHAFKIKAIRRGYGILIRSRIFMGYAGCGCFSFAGLAAYLAISPFLFQKVIGLTPVSYGWLSIFIAGGLAGGGLVNNLLMLKFGRHKLLKVGTLIQFIASIAMLLLGIFDFLDVPSIMIPMFLFMFGSGFVYTNSFAGAFHFYPKRAGFAGAVYGSLQILGGTLASAIMVASHARSQIPLAIFLLCIGILCYFLQELGHRFTLKKENLFQGIVL